MKIVIAGGGVIGLCCAWYLSDRGHEITVIDNGSISDGASFGNAGYISPSHFVPLASPGIVQQALRWMMRSSSPFYIKPRADAELLNWCYLFWRNANARTVERNSQPLLSLLLLSRSLMSELKQESGNAFGMEEKGCLMLYRSAIAGKHEKALAAQAGRAGLRTQLLSPAEVRALEPDTEMNVEGAVLYQDDAHLQPAAFMNLLKDKLIERGVQFRLGLNVISFGNSGNKVQSVITEDETYSCDALVLATGAWLPKHARLLGMKLPLQAGKGYSISFPDAAPNLNYPAILVERRVAMTPMGNMLRMGGTMEISGLQSPPMINRARAIYDAALEYYPGLRVDFPDKSRIWSGLRPLTPDGLPYIGPMPKISNCFIAGGHAMLGLSLAAATGRVLRDMLEGNEPPLSMNAFRPERFC